MSDLNQYSRKFFDSLKVNELPVYLKKLENILKKRFEDEDDFNAAIKNIIKDLKALGHNIYSLEYDSDIKRGREIWGSEYHDRQPNGLEIEFISPAEVHVQWTTASENS